jgi:sugar transferase (PEP-CTERM/EpsH1 system associated)
MMMQPPLVAHIIYRLGTGGLENGLVNLINQTPPDKYRHAIICLKDATDFIHRIDRHDVAVHALHRREGQDVSIFLRLYSLLKRLRPVLVHTRNLAALECQLPAWLAGVKHRIHGEHGWDVFDPEGDSLKYQWLRRLYSPLVHLYIPLSRHIEDYLRDRIRVPATKLVRICNGVDTNKFHPAPEGKPPIQGCPFTHPNKVLIGTVGRMHGVKDQITLVKAFLIFLERWPEARETVRLILVGEGPLRVRAQQLLQEAGYGDLAWLPGERNDVAEILRGLDIFVLPSQAEGISNTILEAMATCLPVIATHVGGNPDLVADGVTGTLVPKQNPYCMAEGMAMYFENVHKRREHGLAARQRVEALFSLQRMVDQYLCVYDSLLRNG